MPETGRTRFRIYGLVGVLVMSLLLPSSAGGKQAGAGNSHPAIRKKEPAQTIARLFRETDLIAILPCTSVVVFEAGPAQPGLSSRGPGGGRATVAIRAQSPLPLWGVCIEPPVLEGPQGDLKPGRIWVRSEDTENVFCSLERPVAILTGGSRQEPHREVILEMQLRPTWLDRPGRYHGEMVVRPFMPRGEDLGSIGLERDRRLGREQSIPVELEIPKAILTSFSESKITFRADAGPGVYPADRDVEFALSTNAPQWRVDYRASDLAGEEGDVRIERMSWERLDRFGRVEDSGEVGTDQSVVSGGGPVKNLEVRLRFKIQITMEDPPGEYGGTISLVGLTDQ